MRAPAAPDDTEKFSYVSRRLWILTSASLLSMSCLVLSQFRLAQSSPWLMALLPCLGFTFLYYVISLRVNAFTADDTLAFPSWARASSAAPVRQCAYHCVPCVLMPRSWTGVPDSEHSWVPQTRILPYAWTGVMALTAGAGLRAHLPPGP